MLNHLERPERGSDCRILNDYKKVRILNSPLKDTAKLNFSLGTVSADGRLVGASKYFPSTLAHVKYAFSDLVIGRNISRYFRNRTKVDTK